MHAHRKRAASFTATCTPIASARPLSPPHARPPQARRLFHRHMHAHRKRAASFTAKCTLTASAPPLSPPHARPPQARRLIPPPHSRPPQSLHHMPQREHAVTCARRTIHRRLTFNASAAANGRTAKPPGVIPTSIGKEVATSVPSAPRRAENQRRSVEVKHQQQNESPPILIPTVRAAPRVPIIDKAGVPTKGSESAWESRRRPSSAGSPTAPPRGPAAAPWDPMRQRLGEHRALHRNRSRGEQVKGSVFVIKRETRSRESGQAGRTPTQRIPGAIRARSPESAPTPKGTRTERMRKNARPSPKPPPVLTASPRSRRTRRVITRPRLKPSGRGQIRRVPNARDCPNRASAPGANRGTNVRESQNPGVRVRRTGIWRPGIQTPT